MLRELADLEDMSVPLTVLRSEGRFTVAAYVVTEEDCDQIDYAIDRQVNDKIKDINVERFGIDDEIHELEDKIAALRERRGVLNREVSDLVDQKYTQ